MEMYGRGQALKEQSILRLPLTESSIRFIRPAEPVWEPIMQLKEQAVVSVLAAVCRSTLAAHIPSCFDRRL